MPERATAVPEREVSRGRSSWSREADKAGSKTAKDRSSGRVSRPGYRKRSASDVRVSEARQNGG